MPDGKFPSQPPPLPGKGPVRFKNPPPLPGVRLFPTPPASLYSLGSEQSGPLPTKRAPVPPEVFSIQDLQGFENLLLFAEATVEGFFAGQHRSAWPGSSAEFRDYKSYVPGDPINRVDWRAYGRTRRTFIRRYDDETDMTAYLLVDASASMKYRGAKRASKYVHAARLAAALAFLMIRQGDKAALGIFAEHLGRFLPPGGTRKHLHEIVTWLQEYQPAFKTGLPAALKQCGSAIKKQGRLVVISDFLTPLEPLFDALSEFLHRGFDILLLQVLDPDELDLPGQQVAEFVDMETGEQIQVDTDDLRERYRTEMQDFIAAVAREANGREIEHQLVSTSEPYTSALESYLGFRAKRR